MPESYFGTPESREREARFVGHEWKGDRMTNRVDREAVERLESHIEWLEGDHERCNPWLARTLRALLAEREELPASQGYTYIGKDGKPILARNLEDQRDALEAKNQKLRVVLEQSLDSLVFAQAELKAQAYIPLADAKMMQDRIKMVRATLAEREKTDVGK